MEMDIAAIRRAREAQQLPALGLLSLDDERFLERPIE
jgi:hypothetical protein